jgi:CheY-like chemotaxis protein
MKRILVIDDDFIVRELLQDFFQMNGFETVTLYDGSEALNIQRKYLFDLVITDILMPIQDGISTIIQLRKEFPDLKIIAISGGDIFQDERNLLKKAEDVGACRTFSKPVPLKPLLRAIQDILSY